MPLLLVQSFIDSIFDRLGYLAPFMLLLGAGAGLPVPEEVTMVGSGFLLYEGRVSFELIFATCWVGTLLGDSIPFWLGRRYGLAALRIPLLAKAIHPERMALIEKRFERHGNWAVFTCRFLPGVRMPGFFSAGTLGMSYVRFLVLDGLGALLMTPAWILLGKVSGSRIARLENSVHNLNQILGFSALALILVLAVRMATRRRERQVDVLRSESREAEHREVVAHLRTEPHEEQHTAPDTGPIAGNPSPGAGHEEQGAGRG